MQHASLLSQQWQTVLSRLPEALTARPLSAQAQSVLTFSDFVQQSLAAYPEWLAELESAPPTADEWQHYATWLDALLQTVTDEASLMRALRQFRRRIMVRIAWAQALRLISDEAVLQQLSVLAETVIVAAREWLYSACCREWGTHVQRAGRSAADAGARHGQARRRRA